jgi:hypothetical protein
MNSVPDYSRFFTVDELLNHSRTMAFNHTVHVHYQNIGLQTLIFFNEIHISVRHGSFFS